MGDRCYYSVRVYRPHAEKFAEMVLGTKDHTQFFDWDMTAKDQEEHYIHLVDESANYGLYDETAAAAAKGLIFTGFSGAGGCYDPAIFCGIGEKFFHVSANVDYDPIVLVFDGGQVSDGELKRVRAFQCAHNRVLQVICPENPKT